MLILSNLKAPLAWRLLCLREPIRPLIAHDSLLIACEMHPVRFLLTSVRIKGLPRSALRSQQTIGDSSLLFVDFDGL